MRQVGWSGGSELPGGVESGASGGEELGEELGGPSASGSHGKASARGLAEALPSDNTE